MHSLRRPYLQETSWTVNNFPFSSEINHNSSQTMVLRATDACNNGRQFFQALSQSFRVAADPSSACCLTTLRDGLHQIFILIRCGALFRQYSVRQQNANGEREFSLKTWWKLRWGLYNIKCNLHKAPRERCFRLTNSAIHSVMMVLGEKS